MPSYYRGASKTGSFWQRHSLSIVLVAIMAVQTIVTLLVGYPVFLAEQIDVSFIVWWLYEYNISLVADVFGAILLVLLSKRLYEKDSAESKDKEDVDGA